MKTKITLAVLSLALAVFASLPVRAAVSGANPGADPGRILRQMSFELGGAQRFTFEAHRHADAGVSAGRDAPEDAHVTVAVMRPNKIKARSTSQDDVREFYVDGVNLSMIDVTKNLYASVAMYGSIDNAVGQLERKFGFTPLLVEFAQTNVYQDILRRTQKISYLGQSTDQGGFLDREGVPCHRLALSGKAVDEELWVGVSDSLPRRMIATFKNRPGKPQIKVEFSNWNLRARVTEQEFVFLRPSGAKKIPLRTTNEMIAARKAS
jgi:hypothetical protein